MEAPEWEAIESASLAGYIRFLSTVTLASAELLGI